MTRKFSVVEEGQKALKAEYENRAGFRKRMCWVCGQEKPNKGGELIGKKGQKFTGLTGFRCAECAIKRNSK